MALLVQNTEGLKLLLNVPNIDVNHVDNLGHSLLHWAVDHTLYSDNIEGLKLMLNHPSSTVLTLNRKNKDGETPVMFAVRWKRLKYVEMLAADPRVDLDTTDKEGRSLEEVTRWFFFLNSQYNAFIFF